MSEEKWREEAEKILDLLIEAEHFRTKRMPPTKTSWPSSIKDSIGEILARVEAETTISSKEEGYAEALEAIHLAGGTKKFSQAVADDLAFRLKKLREPFAAKLRAMKEKPGHAHDETLCPPKPCSKCEKEAK